MERQPFRVNFLDQPSSEGEMSPDRWPVDTMETANAVSSRVAGSHMDLHMPVLDIDYSARLVPSSTEGHFHLYLDREVSWEDYAELLRIMAKCHLIEPGYASASIARGATYVRKEGVRKNDMDLPISAHLALPSQDDDF